MNSSGIASAGGAGRLVAEWAYEVTVDSEPTARETCFAGKAINRRVGHRHSTLPRIPKLD